MADPRAVRVLFVDDHELVAESIRRALASEPHVEVVAVGATLRDGIALASAVDPDIVLLAHRLPDAVGVTAIRAFLRAVPGIRILSCTGRPDATVASAALAAGAGGYIDKTQTLAALLEAVVAVARGERFSTIEVLDAATRPDAASADGPRAGVRDLSPREREVLALLGDGVATRDIAAGLGISQHTVRKHVQTILGKLEAHSKLEGVARARRLGLIDQGPGVHAH